METLCHFLFVDHWLATSIMAPWLSLIWAGMHAQWGHLAALLAYLELVGGPIALLR